MQILVTGAAGFIGFHLTKELLTLCHYVIGIDNLNRAYNPNLKIDRLKNLSHHKLFKFYQGDILNRRFLKKIFTDHNFSTVYHLAARTGIRTSIKYPILYQRVNSEGTKILYQLAHMFGISHFIFASSSSVYGDSPLPFTETMNLPSPSSPYAASKQNAEKILVDLQKQYRIPTTIFRFFSVYGHHGRPDMAPYLFTQAILTQKPLTLFGSGEEARDYTYIDDIVQGLSSGLSRRFASEIINLGNHKPVTTANLISTIESISNLKAKIIRKPRRQEEVKITFADITKAKKLLDWQPQTPLFEGMKKFILWYKKSRFIQQSH